MIIRLLKKSLLVLFILSIIITLVLGFSNRIVCTRYTIDSDKITGRVKIVVVADFHGCRYGEHSEPILKIILEENPDVVLLCGDIYDDELPFDKSNDLVISGHAHGGQVRIPYLLNSGLFAPDQGFFPKYTTGIHELNSRTSLLISRGLAKESTRVPRFFNNPEILSVTLTSGAGTEDGE